MSEPVPDGQPFPPDAVFWSKRDILRFLANTLNRMEQKMSELTDKVDAALAELVIDSTNAAAALKASYAATAVVQAALDASLANEAVNTAQLQRALDGLNAANAVLDPEVPSPVIPVVEPLPPEPEPAPPVEEPAPEPPVEPEPAPEPEVAPEPAPVPEPAPEALPEPPVEDPALALPVESEPEPENPNPVGS